MKEQLTKQGSEVRKLNNAFSLIELLVVVAIIGVIAAVALPAYRGYVLRTKISHVFSVMENFVNEAIKYQQKNGQFPNAMNMGISTNSSTPYVVDNPTSYGSYIGQIHIFNDWRSPLGCLLGITIEVRGAPLGVTFANGWSWSGGNSLMPTMFLIEKNGVITKTCGLRHNGQGESDFAYMPAHCRTNFQSVLETPSASTCN